MGFLIELLKQFIAEKDTAITDISAHLGRTDAISKDLCPDQNKGNDTKGVKKNRNKKS
jgi:hypothetical protein